MAFDYTSPAELFMPKRKGRVRRSADGYRRFVQPRRLFASQLRNFQPSEHSAHGCRSKMSTSIVMKFASCMRVTIIHLHATSPQSAKPKNNCVFGVSMPKDNQPDPTVWYKDTELRLVRWEKVGERQSFRQVTRPLANRPTNLEKSGQQEIVAEAKRIVDRVSQR